MMETKTIKIASGKVEEVKKVYYRFGWILQDENILSDTSTLVFSRFDWPNINKVKKLEKQYYRVLKKVPLAGLILTGLGIVGIIIGWSLYKIEPIATICLYSIFTFILVIGAFMLISFLIILIRKQKIIDRIFKECQTYVDTSSIELPTSENTINDGNVIL